MATTTQQRPVLAVTMGDASGIGPETAVKALAEEHVYAVAKPVVLGTNWVLEDAVKLTGVPLTVRPITTIAEARSEHGTIDVLEFDNLRRDEVVVGQVSAGCGRAAVEYIEEAARLAISGAVEAVVTCPINKEAVHAAGFHDDIGHQEILARVAGSKQMATLLMTEGLRVLHLSTHKSLIEAARFVTKENVLTKLHLAQDCISRWGMKRPRIAVAGLNPHGGEGGMLGREEIDEIAPAVEAARDAGIDARGPFPADSVFYRAIAGEFDIVLALYHDQGHIAIKVHNFEDSVTANLGLPFVRTSVDHGTAFDIAGKGIANHRSLVRAIETAITLVTGRLGAETTTAAS
jgi:4-hydroxythreonine-4-phosphate dehydrogenase